MSLKKWYQKDKKTLFKNDYWSYNLDKFEIEGGMTGDYHYVHSLGSTMIVPFASENEILLVNQFRYLNQRESLEFPCGSVEKGLTINENAVKELREETGYKGELNYIGEFSPYNGVSNEMCSVFTAKNLEHSPLQNDATEEFELVKIPINKFEELIKQNIIWDGLTISSWYLTKNYLNR